MLLRFIGSLRAQRRGAGGVRGRLRGAVLAHHLDVGRADGRGGGGRGTEPRRRASGPQRARRPHCRADRVSASRRRSGALFLLIPEQLLGIFGMTTIRSSSARTPAAAVPERLGLLHHGRAHLYRRTPGHRRHAEPAVHHARFTGPRPAGHLLHRAGRWARCNLRPSGRPSWRDISPGAPYL